MLHCHQIPFSLEMIRTVRQCTLDVHIIWEISFLQRSFPVKMSHMVSFIRFSPVESEEVHIFILCYCHSLPRWTRDSLSQLWDALQWKHPVGTFRSWSGFAERCARRKNKFWRNSLHWSRVACWSLDTGQNSSISWKLVHSLQWWWGCRWNLWNFDWKLSCEKMFNGHCKHPCKVKGQNKMDF